MEIAQLSIIVIRIRNNSLVHELLVMTPVELHVKATYYVQHPALKSIYGKGQSVIAGKLFSSQLLQDSVYHRVFSRFQNKRLELLLSVYETLAQKETLTICHDRVFASFLCALSFSVLRRFIHLYLAISEKNKQEVEDMQIPGLLKKQEVDFPGAK